MRSSFLEEPILAPSSKKGKFVVIYPKHFAICGPQLLYGQNCQTEPTQSDTMSVREDFPQIHVFFQSLKIPLFS